MTPTFPYAGHDHSPVWWALCLLVVAVTTFGLMVLFLLRATRAYDRAPARETTTDALPVARAESVDSVDTVDSSAEQPAPSLEPSAR